MRPVITLRDLCISRKDKIRTSSPAETGVLPYTKVKLSIHCGLDLCSMIGSKGLRCRKGGRPLNHSCMLCMHPQLTLWAPSIRREAL